MLRRLLELSLLWRRSERQNAEQLQLDRLRRHDLLGGVLHEYELAA
jgi:hypothetical protein